MIVHIAIWVNNLELMKAFYLRYFNMHCGEKYVNASKQFASYFLSFANSPVKLELMQRVDILQSPLPKGNVNGLAHFAIATGSKEAVDALTEQLRADGIVIHGEPRWTGDGYYESVVLDPEGNLLEITI